MTDVRTYTPPDYFAVKLNNSDDAFRFYKYNGDKTTSCKIPIGHIVFEEVEVARRVLKINDSLRVKAYRIGFVHFANNKRYNIYKFENYDDSELKKKANEFSIVDFNYRATKQKILALGAWPSMPLPASTQVATQLPSLPPAYVCDLLIGDAVTKGEMCPIMCDSLTKDGSVVTSCFHIFGREAFAQWRKKSSECPTCRAKCSVTK
jgi:hypothetical protein